MRLDDNEKKICLENIKGLRDPNDDLKSKEVPFERLGARDPWVLETVRVHQVWLETAKELLRWGELLDAKAFILEANLHARILKDQDRYAETLHLLG